MIDVVNTLCIGCSANADVQKNALALINAMFQRADLDRRKVTLQLCLWQVDIT